MRLIDITITIKTGMAAYPGDEPFRCEPATSQSGGDLFNTTRLILNTHTGTHLDAPRHFIAHGQTLDRLPVELFVGPARVFDLSGARAITRELLEEQDFHGVTRALLKTSNSPLLRSDDFCRDYAAMDADAARFLVERGVKLLAVDYFSVEPFDTEEFPAHRALLGAGVVILESVDLNGVEAGDYELIALPLKVRDADGSPVRAVLRGPMP